MKIKICEGESRRSVGKGKGERGKGRKVKAGRVGRGKYKGEREMNREERKKKN